jgi:hypothetical protein
MGAERLDFGLVAGIAGEPGIIVRAGLAGRHVATRFRIDRGVNPRRGRGRRGNVARLHGAAEGSGGRRRLGRRVETGVGRHWHEEEHRRNRGCPN